MDKTAGLIALKNLPGIGNGKINSGLCNLCNSDRDDFKNALIRHGFESQDIECAINHAEEILNVVSKEGIKVVTILDREYPSRLLDLGNKKPVVLYYYGDINILNRATIGIIGTRKASEWTCKIGAKILEKISELTDSLIVSGLAVGCDTIAHKEALKNFRETVAVLPSGLLNIYPKENRRLLDQIIFSKGLVFSEYEPNTGVSKHSLLQRDSIVAALSDKILVLECGENGGTMATLNEAIKLSKKIACYLPDESYKGDYSGCAYMIHRGIAKRIATSEDMINWLNTKNESAEQLSMDI